MYEPVAKLGLTRQFPPAPREIRHRPGVAAPTTGRWFILPHVCAGMVMMILLIGQVAIVLFGTQHTAVVTRLRTTHGSKGGANYHLNYTYTGGMAGSEQVGGDQYQQTRVGDKLTIKAIHLADFNVSLIVTPFDATRRMLIFFLCFNLFWNGIVAVFVWSLFVQPVRRTWLLRNGDVASGRITKKISLPGKNGKNYNIQYRYETRAGVNCSGEMPVSAEAYSQAKANQPITVLYDPEKPNRSVGYEISDYTLVDQNGLDFPNLET